MATNKRTAAKGESTWVATATYPEEPAAFERTRTMQAWIDHGIKRRRTVQFMGDHGIGKTSVVRERLAELGLATCYINLANITPDDKLVVAPVTGPDGELSLRQLIMEDLTPGVDFAIVLDDGLQAMAKVQNQFMQLTNGWTLGLHEMPGLKAVIMLDNEGATEGIRQSQDLAQADRKVTVRLAPNDTGWRYALARKYATVDLNEVFSVWDSLGKDLQHVLSPRALDHVLYCTLNGFPPIFGLPIMGDQRMRLQTTGSNGRVQDRTREVLEKISAAVGQPYREDVPDAARKAIRHAIRDHLAIMIMGDPGIGKTAITNEEIGRSGLRSVYYSMPFTDPEALVAPMPTKAGTLKALIAEELRNPDPYVITWDEYNRPASQASFAKLMEISQEWTLAGIPLVGCQAQIALCNPSQFQGRRMQVSKGNIAQADRFTISIQVTADDIPANEWLLSHWPDTVSNGNPDERERARSVIETVLEWWKNDLGDEHRQWITKRTLVRLAELHMDGLPLQNGLIYLGESEFAPVPLLDLVARLADRPMARLKEIASNIDEWETRLRAAGETSSVGTNDVDQVHQALSLAELPQLWENFAEVCRMVKLLPPKLKGTFFIGAKDDHQKLWVKVMAVISDRETLAEALRARP